MSNNDILHSVSVHDEFTIDLLQKLALHIFLEKGSKSRDYIEVIDYQCRSNDTFNNVPCTKGIYFVMCEFGYPKNGFLLIGTSGHLSVKTQMWM